MRVGQGLPSPPPPPPPPKGERFPAKVFGATQWRTFAEVGEMAHAFGAGLRSLGVEPQPKGAGDDHKGMLIYDETSAGASRLEGGDRSGGGRPSEGSSEGSSQGAGWWGTSGRGEGAGGGGGGGGRRRVAPVSHTTTHTPNTPLRCLDRALH